MSTILYSQSPSGKKKKKKNMLHILPRADQLCDKIGRHKMNHCYYQILKFICIRFILAATIHADHIFSEYNWGPDFDQWKEGKKVLLLWTSSTNDRPGER